MRNKGSLTRLSRSRLLAATTALVLVSQAAASAAMAVDVPQDPDAIEITVDAPVEPEEADEQSEGEALVEGEGPVEGETPVEGEGPVEGEPPAEGEAPGEAEAPAEGESPAEGEATLDEDPPVAEQDAADPVIELFAAPVEEFVEGIEVAAVDGAATIYWPDFPPGEVYGVQFQETETTWTTVTTDTEPYQPGNPEGPIDAANEVTLLDLENEETYTARIVSALTVDDILATEDPADEPEGDTTTASLSTSPSGATSSPRRTRRSPTAAGST